MKICEIKKIKQTAVGCLIILSLLVSSVAACVCPHHTEKPETKVSSCHEQPETTQTEDANSPENVRKLNPSDECGCIQPAPKAFSKSETVKIEKQTAVLPVSQVELTAVSQIVSNSSVYFEKPFYLSDSFYNLKSPRAPPQF